MEEISYSLEKWISWLSKHYVNIKPKSIGDKQGYLIVLKIDENIRGVFITDEKTEVYKLEQVKSSE